MPQWSIMMLPGAARPGRARLSCRTAGAISACAGAMNAVNNSNGNRRFIDFPRDNNNSQSTPTGRRCQPGGRYSAASATAGRACGPRTSVPGNAPVIVPLRKVTSPFLMVIT